jgi:hypothetical protein
MKKYRRIEITAFRRRVTIVSGEPIGTMQTEKEVCIDDAGSSETIETESAEGQRILIEAVRLLKERIFDRSRKVN